LTLAHHACQLNINRGNCRKRERSSLSFLLKRECASLALSSRAQEMKVILSDIPS
jgi:hypothetical protein